MALQHWPLQRGTAFLLFTALVASAALLILTLAWQFIAYLRVVRNGANRCIDYGDFLAIRTAVLTHAIPTRFADLKLMCLRVRDPEEVEVWTGKAATDQDARGRTFRLHRIRGFWEVIAARSWKM